MAKLPSEEVEVFPTTKSQSYVIGVYFGDAGAGISESLGQLFR